MTFQWNNTITNFLNKYRQARAEYNKNFDREEEKYERLNNINNIRQKRIAAEAEFQKQRSKNNDVLIDDLMSQIMNLYKKILPFNMDYVAENLEDVIICKLPQTFACTENKFTQDDMQVITKQFFPKLNRLIEKVEDANKYLSTLQSYRGRGNNVIPGFGYSIINKMSELDKEGAINYAIMYGQMDDLIAAVTYTPDNQCICLSNYTQMCNDGRNLKIDAISAVIDSPLYTKAVMLQNRVWINEINQYGKFASEAKELLDINSKRMTIEKDIEKGRVLVKEKKDKNDMLLGLQTRYCRN